MMRTTDSHQVCARRGKRFFISGIAGTDAGDVPAVTGLRDIAGVVNLPRTPDSDF
jgi:hypothetical protein